MKHSAMKDALMKRRGHGLDINLIIGHAPGQGMETADHGISKKDSDLAPAGEHMDEMQDKAMLGQELAKHDVQDEAKDHMIAREEIMKHEMSEGDDNEMLDGMSDYEKQDLGQREKPRSLGERAKMAAMSRLHKK